MTAENQPANARAACRALAPVALEHELVISHGNGPQVGLLALQGAAYRDVETYPLDVLGAQTEGMIGYILEQELGNELPFERRLATVLTLIEVDKDDPAFENPTKPIGPIYTRAEADVLAREQGWTFKPDGDSFRRVVPSPLPRRIFDLEPVEWMLEKGCVVICAGGGGIPVMYTDEPAPAGRRLVGVEAVIDKDLASAMLAAALGADALVIVTDVDAVYTDWVCCSSARSLGRRRSSSLERIRRGIDGAEGPGCVWVRRPDRWLRGDRIDPRRRGAARGIRRHPRLGDANGPAVEAGTRDQRGEGRGGGGVE